MLKLRQSTPPRPKHDCRREGATLVEYGLMLVLVAFVSIAFAALLGTALTDMFKTVTDTFFP